MTKDELYMHRCLQLAKNGVGNVAPNPLVGALIVYNDSVIAEGYHENFGGPHAEVNAVNNVPETYKHLLSDCTIYVTLEPCSHHGKTPPCADLLVKSRFKRVVIGTEDPNKEVAGKGIARLKSSGIDVTIGVLQEACKNLIKHFFTYHTKKRPYVLLKWAQSKNGFIDEGIHSGTVSWISCKETQVLTHSLRDEFHAILVGRKTVENDNPSLTTRAVIGTNPIRVVIDPELKLSMDKNVFDETSPTIVLNTKKTEKKDGIQFKKLDALTPHTILEVLYKTSIQSVIIEGGSFTIQSFIDANLWDEAIVIVGDITIESGTKAPTITKKPCTMHKYFVDQLIKYSNQ